jgi:hypothetical protein
MEKNIISVLIMTLFVLAGCENEPDGPGPDSPAVPELYLAACDLGMIFAEPEDSTFQCGSPVTFAVNVTNRSTELCRRGSITLARKREGGTDEVVGRRQIIPRLGGGQSMLFEFLEQELLKGPIRYTVTVANGSNLILPPEDTIILDDGVADGNEENNTQARTIIYTSSVLWAEIEDLLASTPPTIAPESHPDDLLTVLQSSTDHSDIQNLLASAGKEECTDCHTEMHWGTPENQSPLTQSMNGERTHPENQEPNINCLNCHEAYSSGSESWGSRLWEELPDGVACTNCHGDVFHAWEDYSFPSLWPLFESNYMGKHPGDEIWVNIVKRYALCGDYE